MDTPDILHASSEVAKQPLAKTVAEMFNTEGTSIAETAAGVGNCQSKGFCWEITGDRLGQGQHAEVFEVKKWDIKKGGYIEGGFALKVAKGDPNDVQNDDVAEVEAEAKLVDSIHSNYGNAIGQPSAQCPNVVPVYDKQPCLCQVNKQRLAQIPIRRRGAYVTKKMGGDLFHWVYKDGNSPSKCRGRGGREVYRDQLLAGLHCTHKYGKVAHHDIKSDNVLYDKLSNDDGCPDQLYIADFGLAEPLGKITTFFPPRGLQTSLHRVTDCIEGGASNLDIHVYNQQKELVGYTVSKRIDYCGLIFMCWRDLGWGIKIPDYPFFNCGGMGTGRKEQFTSEGR